MARYNKILNPTKTPPPEPGMIRHRFPVKMATEYICRGFIYEPNAKVQYPPETKPNGYEIGTSATISTEIDTPIFTTCDNTGTVSVMANSVVE